MKEPHLKRAEPDRGQVRAVQIENDFHGWLLDQASKLRSQRYRSLDWSNLAEELEAMAAQQRREIKKHLKKLLAHLLKFKAQPDELSHHHNWRSSVREAREDINDILEDSPYSKIRPGSSEASETKFWRLATNGHAPWRAMKPIYPWKLLPRPVPGRLTR